MNYNKIFAVISYLQYPVMLVGLYFTFIQDFDKMLIFMGLGVGFATLEDPSKTHTKLDKIVFEHPKMGKIFLGFLSIMTLLAIGYGAFGYLFFENEKTKNLSIGFVVFGIGMIGLLKTGAELFENHRKDKNN